MEYARLLLEKRTGVDRKDVRISKKNQSVPPPQKLVK